MRCRGYGRVVGLACYDGFAFTPRRDNVIRIVNGKTEIRVKKIPRPFPERVHAVTVWPLIFYEPHVWDDVCVQVHERYHWLDQIMWLWVPWFAAYLALRPFYGGGRGHPLEKEAYRREDACKGDA